MLRNPAFWSVLALVVFAPTLIIAVGLMVVRLRRGGAAPDGAPVEAPPAVSTDTVPSTQQPADGVPDRAESAEYQRGYAAGVAEGRTSADHRPPDAGAQSPEDGPAPEREPGSRSDA